MRHGPSELDGINISEIARICHVSAKTAKRWKDGTVCPPKTALMVLSRDLGWLDPDWRGWKIRGDSIISPDGWTISRNDALSVPLMHGQIAALRGELRKVREAHEQAKFGEDQPLPGAHTISVK